MNDILKSNNMYFDQVYIGENRFADALSDIITTHTFKNVFLLTCRSLAKHPNCQTIRKTVAPLLSGEYTESQANSPLAMLKSIHANMNPDTDLIIAFGGSSVMDSAKVLATKLNESQPTPIVALPTTLSGAEVTANSATTDEHGVKSVFYSPLSAPRWLILDPALTFDTPDMLWKSTGCKTLSDCIESVCSIHANPYTDQLAFTGIRLLHQHLPDSVDNLHNAPAKQHCLIAPIFALTAGINTWLGLVAGLRHQLAAKFHIPHGIASTIMLPHVLRWNFDAIIPALAQLAKAIDVAQPQSDTENANTFLKEIDRFITQLNIPNQLRDYISNKDELTQITEKVLQSPCTKANPRAVKNTEDILQILELAW